MAETRTVSSRLRASFLHIKGIGTRTEERIWRAGVSCWDELARARPESVPFSPSRRELLLAAIRDSEQALERRDADFFTGNLPAAEAWRVFDEFREECAFLDIETDGGPMGYYGGSITMVGVCDVRGVHAFVRGFNLEDFPQFMRRFRLMVTYNGKTFDAPHIEAEFGGVLRHCGHIDLRYVCRKAGYAGGLKSVEEAMGIARPEEVRGLDGLDAVRLWLEWRQAGKVESLRRLILYNACDILTLEPILCRAANELMKSRRMPRLKTGLNCPKYLP